MILLDRLQVPSSKTPERGDGEGLVAEKIQVGTLRELMRNLQAFRAAYESDGVEQITAPDGTTWHLLDLEYLYEQRTRLSPRQSEAIELCLVQNIKEVNAAKIMGVSPTNPVAMYATLGLKRLIELMESGALPRFRAEKAEVA